MCVSFAESAKTMLSMTTKNIGISSVKTGTVKLSSEHKASEFPPMRSKSTVVNVQNDALVDEIL